MPAETEPNTIDYFFASRLKQFLLVATVGLVITAALSLRTEPLTSDHPDFNKPWDHHKYIWMAENNPFGFHVAPFCRRVVTPTLAKALPFSTERSFFLISFISVWMTAVAVFYLARAFEFSRWTALVGMLMFFTLGWAVKSNLLNIWKPDPLGFLMITLAIYAIAARRDRLYVLLLVIGVGVKESVLFVAPLYYTLRAERPVAPVLALRTILFALPALAALVLLRVYIPDMNNDTSYLAALPETLRQVQLGSSIYEWRWLWDQIGLPRLRSLSPAVVFNFTVGTYGAIALTLPLFSIRHNIRPFVRFLPFLILVYLQLLFATNAERLVVIGFPAVIVMALNGAEAVTRFCGVTIKSLAVPLILLISLMVLKVGLIVVPFGWEALLLLLYLAACFSFGRPGESAADT